MNIESLKTIYQKHGLSEQAFKMASDTLYQFQKIVSTDIDEATIDDIDILIAQLLAEGSLETEVFYGLMRYYYMIGRTDLYIRLTQYTGGIGVMERIMDRFEKVKGHEMRIQFEHKFRIPVLGTPPDKLPFYTEDFMTKLKEVLSSEALLERVLSGNNHGIPDEAFLEEKAAYEASVSLSAYLKNYHQRQVAILKEHAKSGKPWFEQKITDEVVDFVERHPEIQGGVYKDGFIYETKIPYNIIEWLHANNQTDKRYYACHCPFARERITKDLKDIDALWCHCSGGFVKRRYEVIFNKELRAKPLGNALKGDELCRFAIDVRDIAHLQ